jgi:hypothetical protein
MEYMTAPEGASSTYPNTPGSRSNAPETSREAGKTVIHIAKTHRDRIMSALRGEVFGLSSEKIASKTGINVHSVRSRVSELVAGGEVIETPFREKNTEGRNVVVWRVA